MNRCLICFNSIEERVDNVLLCNGCLSKFEILEKVFYYDGVEILVLYKYNDFFKELLYRYKGCYDVILKDAFLNHFLFRLKKKYKGRKIVCAPSCLKDDKKRGFNHVKEIAKILGLEIVKCVKKTKEYKQSEQNYNERRNIQKYIKIDKTMIKDDDPILIVDDVATSLSTIKTIIHLLATNNDKKVLVLASNCRFMGDELV